MAADRETIEQPTAELAKLRVMADANILIAGILFPRWFHEFLHHALKGDFRLVLCPQVIREARQRMVEGTELQRQALEQFLADCDYEETPDPNKEEVKQNRHLVRDVKDVPLALAAIHAKVDYLVTNDKDLTAQDETTSALRQKIQPITVGQFLRHVMGWKSDDLEKIRKRTWSDLTPGNSSS
jgi:predicted nucleic acid-binding protein